MNNNNDKKLNEIADVNTNEVNEFNLCEMIKIKIKDVKENINKETGEKTFSVTIPEGKIDNKIH